MLAEPGEVVYVLPARTRYEQEDGGTETSTERRVIFSPEIPRNDLPEAESEWRMLRNLAFSVRGDEASSLGLDSGPAIRKDIAAAVPSYAGIEHLSKQGDQFQWGGRHLLENGVFPFPNQRARFARVCPPLDEDVAAGTGEFLLATRRGKQFNSMVQAARA
ncbi:MAG: formate dehydrogenase, partial [Planctomycetes bacterium]|nr:formate dehydrogenase [Planctomycetota bacterium]